MPAASPAAVRKQIASGATDPLYLLQGEDEIEKLALAHDFETLVDEGIRAFNVQRIHAGDVSSGEKLVSVVNAVIAAARTLPMMAPRRVVLVLQADGLLVPKRESEAAMRALDQLEDLFTRPSRETTLVLVAGSIDKRSRMYKLLAKQATLVACGTLETPADAERWVRNRVAAAGVEIEPAGARLLADRCGTDVQRLRNDVERLLLYALGQQRVTLADVREIVGPAVMQDDWAMANAIEGGDTREALRQLTLTLDAGVPSEKILGQLAWLVRTRFPMKEAREPGKLRASIDALFRTDLDLKRSGGEPRVLLDRLVVELCARPRRGASGRL